MKAAFKLKYTSDPPLPLEDAFIELGELYTEWDRVFEGEQSTFSMEERALLIKFGFLIEYISAYHQDATSLFPVVDAIEHPPHEYFSNMAQNMHSALYGNPGTKYQPGHVDIRIMPPSLAHILGLVSKCVAPVGSFSGVKSGPRHRLLFLFNAVLSNNEDPYKRNQLILQRFEQTTNLLLFRMDPTFWRWYAFTADQVHLAVLGSGHDGFVDSERQVFHTDMNDLRKPDPEQKKSRYSPYYWPDVFPLDEEMHLYPLAAIMSLLGTTHLLIVPGSWGCDYQQHNVATYDLQPGHLLVFHGNFVHAGREHQVESWRLHWYRPLRAYHFDGGNRLAVCS